MPKKNKRGQNEGSIRERFKTDKKTGKKVSIGWEARYTAGVDKDGKQIQRSIYGKNSDEVKKQLRKVLTDIDNGTYVEPSKLTIGEWMDKWLVDYKRAAVKPRTYVSYQDTIRLHIKPHIGNTPLKDLRPDQIQGLFTTLLSKKSAANVKKGSENKNLSARVCRYVYILIHSALDQALKNGLVMRNVAEAVTVPKHKKKDFRVFTLQEQTKFTETIQDHRLKAAFMLDLFTGLRLGELLALKWFDINFKEGILKVNRTVQRIKVEGEDTKTKIIYGEPKSDHGKRSIPLLDDIVAILKEHKTVQAAELKNLGLNDLQIKEKISKGLVFINEFGNPIDTRCFQRTFALLIKKANIPNTNFHALRHTFATRGLENGIEPKVMQELLGHSSFAMTMDLYSHVLPEKKRESMDKLKDLLKAATK